ncbi:MAG: beta-lactamase family protein [Roseburia sp.]|nr:beta-lactamase family protein [Roseburia sp.]
MVLSEKLKQELIRAVERGEVAGANILILKDGKEAAYAQAGYADLEEKRHFERDTITRLYSMTKPVTSAAAMALMERGLLDLGANVQEFLPGFQNAMVAGEEGLVPVRRPVRIQDLLQMTSGLVYGGAAPCISYSETEKLFEEIKARLFGEEALGTVEIANRLGQIPLAFQPGSAWQYGTSADVLGAVIEVISGKRFGEFLRETFFEPLEMEDTAFYVPEEKQSRLAKVYERTAEGLALYTQSHLGIMNTMEKQPAFESGGAGLASTMDDYSHFAAMLMAQGTYKGREILKPQTVRFMTGGELLSWQQEVFDHNWDSLGGYTYGNLMRVAKEPGKTFFMATEGEYGWDGWLGDYFSNSPKNGITILISQQLRDAGTTSLTRRLKNIVWSELA